MLTQLSNIIVRTVCLIALSLKYSDFNQDKKDDAGLNVVIHLLMDLPTLILISVFSAFAYYLSKLNMEIETIWHQMDESSNAARLSRSNMTSAEQFNGRILQLHGN